EERDFYVYNLRELVGKSASFWLMRMSQVWKEVSFSTGLDSLSVEKQDTVTIDLPDLFGDVGEDYEPVTGIVQGVDYSSESQTLTYRVWLPLREVDRVPWNFAQPYSVSD